ncbi:MAG: hypothetical protein A3G76_12950 [Acidobacteria bacterium RIFCSPLOWO2_12_FULL_65_11]|nr:MAG: hypothetical protein A3H95_03500 [Acidobacteria bacterium RIFCSPLOWO2_02_FULL_64_15]OFW32411.1 MAG: hypothetical protein A3G76_12950 [Acidobacteria bacterium RIFCSPLOWO2_12_FULL_65_11]
MSLISRFLQKLAETRDGDGSLLDHATIVTGSGMSNGNAHSHVGIPFVVAGGDVRGGRHVVHTRQSETPHANLMLTIAQKAGVQIDKFGLSNGTVDL